MTRSRHESTTEHPSTRQVDTDIHFHAGETTPTPFETMAAFAEEYEPRQPKPKATNALHEDIQITRGIGRTPPTPFDTLASFGESETSGRFRTATAKVFTRIRDLLEHPPEKDQWII